MKTKIKVGLPRALLYYKYNILWKTYLKYLGCNTVVSPETNKEILQDGLKDSPDEACLAFKIYTGHVKNLINKCDYILIPRISNYGKNERVCSKFEALYDDIKTTYPSANILFYNIDHLNNHYKTISLLYLGLKLNKNLFKVIYSYNKAIKKQKKYIKELENNLKNRVREIQNRKVETNPREIKIKDVSFDIEMEDQDFYEMLEDIKERLLTPWEEMYEYAKIYYEHYNDLEVPQKFRTNDGYTYEEDGKIGLGNWISSQRRVTSKESEKGYLLTKIGMCFETKNSTLSWEEMYEYAKIYYEHYNDLEVPARFRTNDGYTYEEDGKIRLGNWISSQRQRLSEQSKRGHLLSEIGMRFETKRNTLSWEEMYEYAKIYYEHYNNLEVPFKFMTNDGYTPQEEGKIRLGQWISSQRQKLSQESERGHLLSKIGMRFDNKNLSWEETYEYAKIYYEHYNDLEVPYKFRTNDGYTYEEDGKIRLGLWISNQRQNIPQKSGKIQALDEIRMNWSPRIQKEEVNNLCIDNEINIELNKTVISHISAKELKSKTTYLRANGIELTNEDGKLHEIFSMSSPDMKEKYGISLPEMIRDFYDVKQKRK